jgi:N-acetyl-gamma-glutamyl-phosphate reductase
MNVGVVGASGYSGEVLVKLLLGHPQVKLTAVTSRQHAGKAVSALIPALRKTAADQLKFSDSDPAALAARTDIDLWFLALPHGTAAEFARALVPAGRKVIDLSADFRVANLATYEHYYGVHHAPELLASARFVLPELTALGWAATTKLVAAPGCYPTSTLVPLMPLLQAGLVSREHIVVNSFSGVSGAGKKAEEQYLFVERAESAKAYGLTQHRHLAEIEEQLTGAAGAKVVVQFNPHLAPMRRGIATTITVPATAGATPDTAHVTGSNRVDISAVHDVRTGNFILTSALDNLVKGASGQAVQIMNLWCGFTETAGLI